MYWTASSAHKDGSIHRANLDGSNRAQIITGLGYPGGIVIDQNQDSPKLYWTDYTRSQIMTSDINGRNVTSAIALQGLPGPWGIAVHGSKLFWGNYITKDLQSAAKSGQNITSVHVGRPVNQLTVARPNIPYIITRENHCDGQHCSGICILTSTSFRCIPATF